MIDLDQPCRHCGQSLRDHCDACDCRWIIRMCDAGLLGLFPGLDETHGDPCRHCGRPLREHFDFAEIRVKALGALVTPRGELRYPMPSHFHDCRGEQCEQ